MKATATRVQVLPDPTSDPWPVLWQSFERSMRAANSSPRTLEVYAEAGRQFHAFQLERGLPTDPVKIEKQHAMGWRRAEAWSTLPAYHRTADYPPAQ